MTTSARITLGPAPSWEGGIADSDLPAVVRHVALTLRLYMNDYGDLYFPGFADLAAATGRTEETCRRAVGELWAGGWLDGINWHDDAREQPSIPGLDQ